MEILSNLRNLIGEVFDEVLDDIDMYISEEDTENNGVIIKDSENNGYDKIAYVNTENSTCYCFVLENGIITDIF